MLKQVLTYLRRHHVGLVAVVLALGGTAYAANQIGSKQIKNESIRSVDLRDGALRGADVREGSIGLKHLKSNASSISSAQVFGGADGPSIANGDGFTSVERTGTGEYTLTLAPGNQVCSVAATPIAPFSDDGPTVTIGRLYSSGQTVAIGTYDKNGDPTDLGAAFGWEGFSILGTC